MVIAYFITVGVAIGATVGIYLLITKEIAKEDTMCTCKPCRCTDCECK